jgi:hypothetical protein
MHHRERIASVVSLHLLFLHLLLHNAEEWTTTLT